MKYFCVSDVHSFFNELMTALDNAGFEKDNPEHILCVLGDLFDRGDGTVQLFEFIKDLYTKNRLIYILGNHEDLLSQCVQEISSGYRPSSHHFSNGTVKTICQFCGEDEWIIYDPTWRDKICETLKPVLDFIYDTGVNYAEIGDHILVHGWIPESINLEDKANSYYYSGLENKGGIYNKNWRNADIQDWKDSRWLNGMNQWKQGIIEPGKTIVCGHWHCSWGWAYIKRDRKEFPEKNRKDWQKSFDPFVEDGIIAIDACTAYSGKINVITLEVDENEPNNKW